MADKFKSRIQNRALIGWFETRHQWEHEYTSGTWICLPIVAFPFFYWIKITMPPLVNPLVLFIISMTCAPRHACAFRCAEVLILMDTACKIQPNESPWSPLLKVAFRLKNYCRAPLIKLITLKICITNFGGALHDSARVKTSLPYLGLWQ
jgi:hypothetical protein